MTRLRPWLAGLALLASLTLPASALPSLPPLGPPQTLVLFDAAQLETPQALVLDRDGNFLISLALTGEIRKIAPDGTQSTLAFLPIGAPLTPCFGLFGIQGAMAEDRDGNLFVNVASCDLANRGVWKVTPAGVTSLVANLPGTALPNGIALFRDDVLVADSFGLVWRAPQAGGTAEVWLDDPLIRPAPGAVFPGPNGLQIFRGEVYIANSDQGTILAVRLRPDGSAGRIRVHATLPNDLGCDDFDFDVLGNLYCTTDPFGVLLRIFPNGGFETLLTTADGLDGPTYALFGKRGFDRLNLYITNAAFPFFTTTFRPSLMRVRIGIPGAPRR
jgi:sugar lactone lactonase YvrE